jgi:hypothetical protein
LLFALFGHLERMSLRGEAAIEVNR